MEDILFLRGTEIAGSTDRRSLILLRWMLVLSTAALFLASQIEQPVNPGAAVLVLAFAGTNVALYRFWNEFKRRQKAELLLAIVDALVVSIAIFAAGIAPVELLIFFFLVLILVALGHSMQQIVASGVALAFLYVWMMLQIHPIGTVLTPAFLIRIPFLYSAALYFGHFAARAGTASRVSAEAHERMELRALMDILETINSTLDLHLVMLAITSKMAEAVGVDRCSALLVESGERRSIVLASSDVPDVDRLEIDLDRYPEVRRAIELREPVVIDDVQKHPLMEGVRHFVAGAGFNSILVVPMIHRDDLVGTLLLRAASSEAQFSPRVVSFCQAIASASANALKNALLYRQVREESARHRATVEKLQNILQHSMDLIVTTDLEGRITDFNRSAEEWLGYRREEIVGQPLTDIYRVGDRSSFLASLRGKGQIDEPSATMTARDGSRRTFDLTVAVVRNDLGELVGSVCVGKKLHAHN